MAQAFAGYPGRKTLVWAMPGFPFALNEETMALKEGCGARRYARQYQPPLSKDLGGVESRTMSVYPVDVHGWETCPDLGDCARQKPLPDPFTHGHVAACRDQRDLGGIREGNGGKRAYLNRNGLASR